MAISFIHITPEDIPSLRQQLSNDTEAHNRIEFAAAPEKWLDLLNENRSVWIIKEDETSLGLVDIEKEGESAHFAFLIFTHSRGQGKSSAVLEALIQSEILQGITKLSGYVETDNAVSLHILEKASFSREGIDQDGLVIMSRTL